MEKLTINGKLAKWGAKKEWTINAQILTTEDMSGYFRLYAVDDNGTTILGTSQTINFGVTTGITTFTFDIDIPSPFFFSSPFSNLYYLYLRLDIDNNSSNTGNCRLYTYQTTYSYANSAMDVFGTQGFQGPQGITGPQGTQGRTGPQGTTGNQGITGPQGTTGPQGVAGPTGFTYPVTSIGVNSLWYNSGDLITPAFTDIPKTYSDGNGVYIEKGSLYLVENISAPVAPKTRIQSATQSGLTTNTWTIPWATDTFVGLSTTQTLSNKIFTSIQFNLAGVTAAQGDLYYTQTTNSNIQRLAIGATGSILSINNNNPLWVTPATNGIVFRTSGGTLSSISPGSTNSVLSIVNGAPTYKLQNITKTTDSNAVTGVIVNTLLDSVLIPANTIVPGDIVEFKTRVRKTGTAGTMIQRFYIGTQSSITGTNLVGLSSTAAATTLAMTMNRTLVVKSSTQSETFGITNTLLTDDGQASTIAVTITNIDWTKDQFFISAIQPSSTGDSIRNSHIQIRIND